MHNIRTAFEKSRQLVIQYSIEKRLVVAQWEIESCEVEEFRDARENRNNYLLCVLKSSYMGTNINYCPFLLSTVRRGLKVLT